MQGLALPALGRLRNGSTQIRASTFYKMVHFVSVSASFITAISTQDEPNTSKVMQFNGTLQHHMCCTGHILCPVMVAFESRDYNMA